MEHDDGTLRFRRMEELFDRAVELPPDEQEAFLGAAVEGDPELIREVLALLQADADAADRDLKDAVGRVAASLTSGAGGDEATGRALGPWRIVRPLGEGGMGTVYLAERADGEFDATAAVKLVRGGLPSPFLEERLRAERQILAGLVHPNIARLLDGGSTEDGTPYLVMEFVEGTPITTWCDDQAATPQERVRLFLEVCDAVAYAHQQLVVHHDIKPGNILVTREGKPKLLDFGVARIVDTVDAGTSGEVTSSWFLVTPAYASPEQLRGERAGAAADIYALGVLLYRLLAGRLPLELDGLPRDQATRRVLDEVPPVLSAVADVPRQRQFQGDMDAILSRALRKEPGGRYPSVTAFAEDIRRHLDGLPISARRDDWRYRAGKFVRRNRGAVSSGALVTLLLLAFTISSVAQARGLARERDRAERERETAQRVTGFLTGLFEEADPNRNPEPLTARELVDRGAASLFDQMRDEPEVRGAVALALGGVYQSLGAYAEAAPFLDSAEAVARREGVEAEELAVILESQGALAYDLGDYDRASAAYTEGLEAALASGDGVLAADLAEGLAGVEAELAELEVAEARYRDVLALRRSVEPRDDGALATTLLNLADVLRSLGEYDEAVTLGEECLELTRSAYGPNSLQMASALNHLASTIRSADRPADALPYLQEGLAVRRAVHPDGHPETAASLGNLSGVLGALQRHDEAERARRESLAMFKQFFPDEHLYVAATTHSLGESLVAQEKYDEALQTLLEGLRLHRAALGEDHPNNGYPLTALGRLHLTLGEPDRAEPYLREAYRLRREGLGREHWFVGATALDLGRAVDEMGRRDEARALLEESHRLLAATFGDDDRRTAQARTALAAHYRDRGMSAEAEALMPDAAGDGGSGG
jgi:serine/threonine-protein kinase